METPMMHDIDLAMLEDDMLHALDTGPDDEDSEDLFDEDGFELDELDSMDAFDDDFDDDDY